MKTKHVLALYKAHQRLNKIAEENPLLASELDPIAFKLYAIAANEMYVLKKQGKKGKKAYKIISEII